MLFMCIKATISAALWFVHCTLVVKIKRKKIVTECRKVKKLILHLKTKDRMDSVYSGHNCTDGP